MPNQAQALYAQELLKRRGIRRDLNEWARHVGFEPAKHHQKLNEVLMRAARGEIKKVAVFMPPGSAKSTYSSVLFPPWFLAQKDSRAILLCSHSKDLAESFGRRCRNLIDGNPLQLGYGLAKDSQAAGEWGTDKNGGFFCAGVGGRISGRRADLAVIDDPIGSREDADSKLIRDKQWAWYNTDFKPRLKPNAVTVIIMTRFHEDDLMGRILNGGIFNGVHYEPETDWEVVRFPMEAKENDPLGRSVGERLWSNWFTEAQVFEAKKDPRTWSALYQQDPTPESGNFFEADWLVPYTREQLPPDSELRFYVGSDHAVSLQQEADLTCIIPVGVDRHDNIWVLPDIFWKRVNTKDAVQQMITVAQRRQPLMWWAESAHIEKAIGPFLTDECQNQNVYFAMEQLSSARDKRTKAQSIQGRMAQGKVRFPVFCSWWEDAKRELLTFDAGTHDDFVDALANIGRGLHRLQRPDAVSKPKPVYQFPSVRYIKAEMRRTELEKEIQRAGY